jgi:hypothetical protein
MPALQGGVRNKFHYATESKRDTLRQRYGLTSTQPAGIAADDMPFDIFATARKVFHDYISQITADEVDNYFEKTKHSDTTCTKML